VQVFSLLLRKPRSNFSYWLSSFFRNISISRKNSRRHNRMLFDRECAFTQPNPNSAHSLGTILLYLSGCVQYDLCDLCRDRYHESSPSNFARRNAKKNTFDVLNMTLWLFLSNSRGSKSDIHRIPASQLPEIAIVGEKGTSSIIQKA